MASPLMPRGSATAEPRALQLLEDAVHLLRSAPLSTLAWHWAGALPLAAAAVDFWSEMNNPHTAGSRLTLVALATAVLYGWLNFCRALYASRLRDQLAGLPPQSVPVKVWWDVAATQTWLGATKLAVIPLAAASGIFLAPVVAFYRTCAALSVRESQAGPLTARSRRYVRQRRARNWRALGLLACIYPILLFNVIPALAMLPQLGKVLTGFETPFSRMGARILEDPLFWSLAFAITWLLFDPLIQAVYCVACFEAESAETGEDVKGVLRRLRPAAAAVVALAICIPSLRAEAVPPEDLHRAIQQAAQSPDYDWRVAPALANRQQPSWFVSTTDRIVSSTRAFLRSVSDALGRLLRWIFGSPQRIDPHGGAPPSKSLPTGIWVLIALAVGAALFAVYRARRTRSPRRADSASAPLATAADAEELDPLRFPEQTWIELGERSIAEENWRVALRAFYLANLGWLGRRDWIQIHPGKTNREYASDLRRRAGHAPGAREEFNRNLAAFEHSWYGGHETTPDDVQRFRDRLRQIQADLEAAV